MNIALLKKEARETSARMQGRLDAAIGEDRDLTEEEQAAQDEDQKKLDRQLAHIASVEELAQQTAGIGADPTAPPAPAATLPAQPRNPKPSNDGFTSLGEFAQAVRLANPASGQQFKVDERLAAPSSVVTESGDEAGSYLVPAEYREEIVDLVFDDEEDAVMQMIDPEPTSKNRVAGLGDASAPWGDSGIQAYWRVEAEQMTPSKPALEPRETKLNELYAFVNATEELLEDAPRLDAYLRRKAPEVIRWKASDAFVWGDGVAKPLGWMSSAARVDVAKESGQAADTIVAANIGKAYARMINPMRAEWLANSGIMPQLMELEGGNGTRLWQPDYRESPGGTLLGRPIRFSEHAAALGDLGDLQFVNPRGYEAFRKQNGISFADSIHLYFDYNVRAFRWIFRIGGQPVLDAPVAQARGATKSHFVAIAARA